MIDLGMILDLRNWAHVKHISEISEDDQERAAELRGELCEIFRTCALLAPKEARLQMKEVTKLIKDIEKLGFFVNIQFSIKNVEEDSALIATICLYTLKTKTIH